MVVKTNTLENGMTKLRGYTQIYVKLAKSAKLSCVNIRNLQNPRPEDKLG